MLKSLLQITLLLCTMSALAEVPGQVSLDAGDYDKARAEVAAAAKAGESSELTLMLGRISLAENKLDEAEKHIEHVIEDEPDNAEAHSLRGGLYGLKASRASLFRAGRYAKQSLASLERALELDPELEEALIGMIRFRLSAPRLLGGSKERALKSIKKLQSVNPVAGGLQLADLYGDQKDQTRQLELLRELTESHANDPRAFVTLGYIMQQQNEWEKAGINFKAAVSAGKGAPEHTSSVQAARYQVGRSAVLSKTESTAEINLGIAALSDYIDGPRFGDLPDLAWAHYRRGLLYERLGDRQTEAEKDFSVAATSSDRDLQRALGGR
ncbi:MAG: tetratricopeptide repeat protein [Gammaproteobacteria bacterium]